MNKMKIFLAIILFVAFSCSKSENSSLPGNANIEYATKRASHSQTQAIGVKYYIAVLTQFGSDNPTASVLENSFTPITITPARTGIGVYSFVFDDGDEGPLLAEKTWYQITTNKEYDYLFVIRRESRYEITVSTYEPNFDGTYALADGLLNYTPIKIELYP